MKLTKWEHACMVLERGKERLVIDPGSYTSPIDGLDAVVAMVITHEHADHWTPEQLGRVLALNPKARLFGTEVTAANAAAAGVAVPVEVVRPGDEVTIGEFNLKFFGGRHAIIHSSIPQIDNVGVLVNDTLYYPGDSFFVPDVAVPVLAAPASAPWMKMGETMDFVLAVKPKHVIQAHEMINSQLGNNLVKQRLAWAAEQVGADFTWLEPGDTYDL